MRVLVTGAAGFTGVRMMEFLAAQRGVTPIGLVRRHIRDTGKNSDSFIAADLLDCDALHEAVVKICPDAVIHLAGLTRGTPEALHATNVTGTKNLLDTAVSANPDCRILVVSSSAVYGYAGDVPIPETAPLKPVSDYGTSKVAQDILALMHYHERGINLTIARPFNLTGPGQADTFLCGKIVRQVVEFDEGKRDSLDLLETQSSRDFIDVRDVVKAYWALVTHPRFKEDCTGKTFNIGSGRSCPISEVIATLEMITGKRYPVNLPTDPQQITIPSQQSDISRIHNITGWKPEISLKNTLNDMLTAERTRIKT